MLPKVRVTDKRQDLLDQELNVKEVNGHSKELKKGENVGRVGATKCRRRRETPWCADESGS